MHKIGPMLPIGDGKDLLPNGWTEGSRPARECQDVPAHPATPVYEAVA